MKKLIVVFAVLSSFTAFGQRKVSPADSLWITGKVNAEMIFTLASLDSFATISIDDLAVSNHKGEIKGTAKNMKGFLVKQLLEKLVLPADKPKILSEFYFVFIASDNYKVVFSWNEIFNTETGNNLYLVTEKEGKKMREMDERILIVSTKDFQTGRRYIKGLERIVVERVN